MKSQSVTWSAENGLSVEGPAETAAQLVVYFGSRDMLTEPLFLAELRALYPAATMMGCSSGGQIVGGDVADDVLSAVALRFEHASIRAAEVNIVAANESRECGRALARRLAGRDLAGIFVLSDGLNVNGSELVAGIGDVVGARIPICGGLAGDGSSFERTMVGLSRNPSSNVIAAIGFYGSSVRIGYGSAGGWTDFGPARAITRSTGNVLYELDGEPALDLYERYLCPEDISALPGSGLRFPLLIRNPECVGQEMVRTILAVDRSARSITFAGDMPRGWTAQLMRSTFDGLAAGAAQAGTSAGQAAYGEALSGGSVGILISCIGRRLMMGQHVTDEIEAACDALPAEMAKLGFYSYGEISPLAATGSCELHNQTMTIMTIAEAA